MSDQWARVIATRLRAVAFGVLAVTAAVVGSSTRLIFGIGNTGDLFAMAAFAASAGFAIACLVLAVGGEPPKVMAVGTRNGPYTWDGKGWTLETPPAP